MFVPGVLNAVFDKVIGWHDAAGTLIASDDDSGEFGSVGLTGSVGAGGTLNLSVFTNPLNEQSGAYSLRLSLALDGRRPAI